MCGRMNDRLTVKDIEKLYAATAVGLAGDVGSYNTAPTELAPIVQENADHQREINLAAFGITMSSGGKAFPLINLQSEKAGNREDFQTRRCVVPAAGFYEWEKISPKDKQPYYFSPVEGVFSFAGVWKQSATGLGFSVLTTSANDLVGAIHGRMPVILSHNAVGAWLDPKASKDTLSELMKPYPEKLMQAWKVSKAMNSPKNKDAACINSL